ncbi:hypothetical protein Vadar_014053 [Vaccinium darrowii]|uniref:Uncharacterized protein n=1 Tax=Vaccinium darrowii TaxID=229202 RepID=A0ACB7Y877_9ERIC|nr:hypothetical protein Vadar_014053 [Vaccinium darrowii]
MAANRKIEAEKNEERTESFFLTDLAPLSSTKMTMLIELEPGPIDDSILTRQASHRSARVWDLNGLEESVVLTCRRRELALSRVAVDPRLLPLIKATGFTGLMKVPFYTTRLASYYSTGRMDYNWPEECDKLLGVKPTGSNLQGGRLNLGWLEKALPDLPDNADDATLRKYARAYILQLMGASIFSDKSSKCLHLMFLPLLEDLDQAGQYSWGSGALGWLYRDLCRATMPTTHEIGGCLIVLQVWAWDRFPYIAPLRCNKLPVQSGPLITRGDPKWKGKGKEESSSRLHLRPRIPGPAGVLQEAMERRAAGEGVETMNIQEFLNRAHTVESEDTDFMDNSAWLTAVRQGYLQDPKYTDLATVNKMSNLKRVPLVVALVKSCVRNQLGEPLLELKDPTGSVWATIHWKAYDEELFPGILKLPGLRFVEINFTNSSTTEIAVQDLLEKVAGDQLFICRVESEPRKQLCFTAAEIGCNGGPHRQSFPTNALARNFVAGS